MIGTLLTILLAALPVNARTIDMSVTNKGFEPATATVRKGEPLHLVVTRKLENTCAKELVIKDMGLRKKLPLDQAVAFDFTPKKTGELRYVCGMNMLSGTLLVQ